MSLQVKIQSELFASETYDIFQYIGLNLEMYKQTCHSGMLEKQASKKQIKWLSASLRKEIIASIHAPFAVSSPAPQIQLYPVLSEV